MNVRSRFTAIVLAAASFGLTACTTFYLVKDPETGHEYYTTNVDHTSHGITFEDGKSRSMVTLQNSEIIEITKVQYEANAGKP
jgi:hypothetical protein